MFKVGDIVRNVAADAVGVVIEVDGDTVYIERPNGCEVDFVASALVLESEFQAKHDTSVRDDPASHEYDAIYAAVLGKMYSATVEMGQRAHAQAKRVVGVAPKGWDELSALQKLNAISEASGIAVKAWIESNRPGANPAIGPLQLSVLAAVGLEV